MLTNLDLDVRDRVYCILYPEEDRMMEDTSEEEEKDEKRTDELMRRRELMSKRKRKRKETLEYFNDLYEKDNISRIKTFDY